MPVPASATMPPEPDPPTLGRLSLRELLNRRDAVARLVEEDGVVVGQDASGGPLHLGVDPLPYVIEAAEWARLERGLAQRAHLLSLLLDDLYGPRTLLARGLLPPELVVGHPGFVPPADGVPTHHVLHTAADLGRDADGRWAVLADRTQAPVGAGYAMAVRRITARALAPIHRRTPLRRLRGYFDARRAELLALAAAASEAPRVVVLRAPELDVSTFDETFEATLLGFPVVGAEDLTLRGGRVWLTTTERQERVDVAVRRVDARLADPLDLDAASQVGVPGLVEATRRGLVAVVNPVGAGVLENPALGAFLPAIARALLGEELLLPSARTWWCGDQQGRRYAAAHLDDLVLSPLSPSPSQGRVFTAELSASRRAALWGQVEGRPWAWCVQERLPAWTAPVVTASGPVERPGLLRTFALSGPAGPTVMPGGLARFAATDDALHAPIIRDAVTKDVWVLAEEVVADAPSRPSGAVVAGGAPPPRTASVRHSVPLSPRAAEDLYWFGRYAERAESTARLLVVADDLVEDHLNRRGTPGHAAMRALLAALDAVTANHRYHGASSRPERPMEALPDAPVPHLRALVFDGDRPGSVRYSARRARAAAGRVRELLSFDTWLVLSRLERALAPEPDADDLPRALASVVESCLALAGIGAEGLVRDASWAFHDAGRRVERAQETVRVLRRTVGQDLPGSAADLLLESTLRGRESLLSYRRRLAEGRPGLGALGVALELLLVDAGNPRSVVYQLDRLHADLVLAAPPAAAALREPRLLLAGADVAALAADRPALNAYLGALERELHTLSGALEATCFPHRAPLRAFEETP